MTRSNRMTDMERSIEARMVAKNMTPDQFWDWFFNGESPVEINKVNKVDQDGWTTYDPKTVKL